MDLCLAKRFRHSGTGHPGDANTNQANNFKLPSIKKNFYTFKFSYNNYNFRLGLQTASGSYLSDPNLEFLRLIIFIRTFWSDRNPNVVVFQEFFLGVFQNCFTIFLGDFFNFLYI